MENLNKNHENCQFEMDIPADVLAYINGEHISQDDIRNVIAKVLSKFETPKSGSRNFFRSRKSDLGVMCKFHYCEEEKLSIELIFAFRLSAKELNFSYKGKKIRIFYSADDDKISLNIEIDLNLGNKSALYIAKILQKKIRNGLSFFTGMEIRQVNIRVNEIFL